MTNKEKEINSQITDILLDSMPAGDAEETEEQEQEQQPEEEQKEETAPKKSSLLDKYRKK